MKKSNLIASLMATITFVLLVQWHQSYGQSFYPANNADVSSRCYVSGTVNTNNDYIESPLGSTKRSVIVYDGAHPGLFRTMVTEIPVVPYLVPAYLIALS